jgi:hypothetical protein
MFMAAGTITRLFGALRGRLVILLRVTRFSTLATLIALAAVACVPKAPRRASSAEARAGVPRPGGEQASVEQLLHPSKAPNPPRRVKPGQVYSLGYWHWDGVRYVQIGGTVENSTPPYVWQYDTP